MRKLNVLCDMDGILVDLFRYWLDSIELEHGVKVLPEEIVRWDMHKCGALNELGAAKTYAYLQREGFFRQAPALPGAIAGIQRIAQEHNVFILSSPSGPISAKEKLEWLAAEMPFIPAKNIMLANAKTMVKGDVLIDDHPTTIVDYKLAWPAARVIGIEYPYNKQLSAMATEGHIDLVPDYRNTQAAWTRINQIIDEIAARG